MLTEDGMDTKTAAKHILVTILIMLSTMMKALNNLIKVCEKQVNTENIIFAFEVTGIVIETIGFLLLLQMIHEYTLI